MTGDVFRGPQIPGLDEHELLMVITHPCTMRGKHGALKPKLQALPVKAYQEVPLDKWPDHFFRVMPLPNLQAERESVAARLDESGMVPSSSLDLDARVACLSELGIKLLLQRYFHCFSRVKVSLEKLSEALAGPLQEAELLEEWTNRSRKCALGTAVSKPWSSKKRRKNSIFFFPPIMQVGRRYGMGLTTSSKQSPFGGLYAPRWRHDHTHRLTKRPIKLPRHGASIACLVAL